MIDLYIHTSDGVDPKLVKASEESTVKSLIQQLAGEDDSPFSLYREDEEEAFEKSGTLSKLEIRNRSHLHLGRCKKVRVYVFYNGEKHEDFPPAAKVKRVLKWAIKEFGFTAAEAAEKVLVLSSNKNTELPIDAHIGSFTPSGECSLKLCLVTLVEIQG